MDCQLDCKVRILNNICVTLIVVLRANEKLQEVNIIFSVCSAAKGGPDWQLWWKFAPGESLVRFEVLPS